MTGQQSHFCKAIGGRVQGPAEKCAFCENGEVADADL